MKNHLNIIAAAAFVLLANACVRETNTDTIQDSTRRYELSFDSLTKTELSGEGSTRQVKWNQGDAIKYYTESNQSKSAEATVNLSGDKAYVTIPRGRTDEFINAVYGATQLSSAASSENCIYINSPVKSNQRYTSFAEAHVCAAFSDDIEEPTLHFRNAVCIIRFTSAADVHKLVFSGNSGEIITAGNDGNLKITCSSSGSLNIEPASSGQTSVTVATDGEQADFYFSILPVSFSGGITVDCYDADGELFVSKRTSVALNTVSGNGTIKLLDLGKVQDWIDNPTPMVVDLGLSVKWSSFNLGASAPEEYGDYFSWGETSPKTEYKWATYLYSTSKNGPFSEYVLNEQYGTPDYKLVLDLEDDAAAVNWGNDWRLPTKDEVTELMTQCTWTWTERNGISGYKILSGNGNSIFLPANGMRTGSSFYDVGAFGNYWSSSISEDGSYFAVSPIFSQSGRECDNCYRYFGLGVRPVYGTVVPVSEITLPESIIFTMGIKETKTLSATLLPDNATYKNLTWVSSDPSIATVDTSGKVTAVSLGTTTVTVFSADGVKYAVCEVSVNQPIESITLDKESLDLYVGDEPVALIATILPEEHTDKVLNWYSSNTDVTTVDDEGRVTAVSAGTATITATARDGSGEKATCTVTVYEHVSSISLNRAELIIYTGQTATLTATILPETANKSVVWSSDNESVVKVNQTGDVIPISPGIAMVTATTEDCSLYASCEVTVKQYATSISLDKTSLEMYVGDAPVALMATVLPDDATDKMVQWSSEDETIATVDSDGKVAAVSYGSTKITVIAKDGSDVRAECAVMVNSKMSKPDSANAVDLGLSVKWATCNVGASSPQDYGAYFAWGETQPKEDFSWSTYRWCNGSNNSLTKYNNNSSYGTVDNKTVLDSADDAAHVHWGGAWRMPTEDEVKELVYNTETTFECWGSVYGRVFRSTKEGYTDKWIFLPSAGQRYDLNLYTGSWGRYWSSSTYSSNPAHAVALEFDSGNSYFSDAFYYYGFSVRPVCE